MHQTHTPDHEVEALVEKWAQQIHPLVARVEGPVRLPPVASDLLDELSARELRPVHYRAVQALQRRLAEKQPEPPTG